jgi:uncharacterized membrane protein (UPF0127 family)
MITRIKNRNRTNYVAALFLIAGTLLAFALPVKIAAAQAMLLPTTELSIGPHQINAEVAATDASRSYGLMNRDSLPPNHGMLFVFEHEDIHCFWMKNTPLPLSIAFINAKGQIVNIADMQPRSEAAHCPTGAVLYALEMERGWFAQNSIKAGEIITGLPKR